MLEACSKLQENESIAVDLQFPIVVESLQQKICTKRQWVDKNGGISCSRCVFFEHKPIGSMYGIFSYIYHKNQPNVGKYTSPMDPMANETR